MNKRDKIKIKLQVAVVLAKKQVSDKQLNEAADDLLKRSSIVKEDLSVLGLKVAGDREIFASTDTDDMNNLLGGLGDK